MQISNALVFLKWGGSLITDKTKPRTPRLEVLERLADELCRAWEQNRTMRLLLGHGSGSFGHSEARKHGTQHGVRSAQAWLGFGEVWYAAAQLNRLVVDVLHARGLPVIALSPASMVTARNREIITWNLQPLQAALEAHLLPVLQGDVIFDEQLGGCILSTEDLFTELVRFLHPSRVLLAGIEAGVWADYPACTQLLAEITPKTPLFSPSHSLQSPPKGLVKASFSPSPLGEGAGVRSTFLQGSAAPDVTGGMAAKVAQSLLMVSLDNLTEVIIFSGEEEGAIEKALTNKAQLRGTRIHNG